MRISTFSILLFPINGQVSEGELKFVIASQTESYGEEFIEDLGKELEKSVNELADYCAKGKKEEKTASDYGVYDLTVEEFDEMQKSFEGEVEKIYGLTPLQEGMLFHNLEDRESTGYVVQSIYDIGFEADNEKLKEALRLLSKRYDILRTSFKYEKISEPKQVIYAERTPELEVIESREEECDRIAQRDIKRGVDLEKDTMLRVKSIKTGEGKGKLIFTIHHIIIDGWCMGILTEKLFDYYFRLKGGKTPEEIEKEIEKERSSIGEYSEYVTWLEKQENEKAKKYWEEELKGYENDCRDRKSVV